jgi:hypothetical protein
MTRAAQSLLDLNYFLLLLLGLSLVFTVAFSQAVLIVLLVSTGALLLLGGYRQIVKLPLFYPILIFMALRAFSIIFSQNYEVSSSEWQKWWLPLAYFAGGVNLNRSEKAKGMVWVLTVVGGVAGVYATVRYLLSDIERAVSTSGGHDTLANYLVLTACLLLSQIAVDPKAIWRQWKTALILPIVSGLVLTFARAAYLAFFVAVGAVGFLKKREIVLISAALVVVFLILWAAGPAIIKDRLSLSNPLFASERDILWRAGFQVLKEVPPWGHGACSFGFTFPPEYTAQLLDTKIGNWHNLYLETLLDSGYLTLLVLVWILVWSFRFDLFEYRRRGASSERFLAGLALGKMSVVVSLAIMGLFAVVLSDPIISMLFWIVLALNCHPDICRQSQ